MTKWHPEIFFALFLFLHGAMSACGPGRLSGTSGAIDGMVGTDSNCAWKILVDEELIVELTFHIYDFSTGTSTTREAADKIVLSEANVQDTIFTTTTSSVPGLVYSTSSEITLTLTRGKVTNLFYISWRAVPDPKLQCCSSYMVGAATGAKILDSAMSSTLGVFLGTYTWDTSKACNGPIYSRGNRWLARMDANYARPWGLSSGECLPGWTEGMVFFGGNGVCPGTEVPYEYYDSTATPPFKLDDKNIKVECSSVCTGSPPDAPPGSTGDSSVPTSAQPLTQYSYKCTGPGNFMFFSICQKTGLWSPVNGACPDRPSVPEVFVLPSPDTITTLTAEAPCMAVRSPGWPKAEYAANEVLTWKFIAAEECDHYVVKFDPKFNVAGIRKACIGDKVSSYYGDVEIKRTCGTTASDVYLTNDGTENKVVFTSDKRNSGIGFKAKICIVGCL